MSVRPQFAAALLGAFDLGLGIGTANLILVIAGLAALIIATVSLWRSWGLVLGLIGACTELRQAAVALLDHYGIAGDDEA